MKWMSTLWEMSQHRLNNYLEKHQAAVNKLYKKLEANGWIDDRETKLFSDLLDGYKIMEELYMKQESVHENRVKILERRIQELEKCLHLTPENSHKPPSANRFKKIKNSRVKTGKKIGAQSGHKGIGPEIEAEADQIIRYEQRRCRSCGRELKLVADAGIDKRQEIEIKSGVKHITEHQRITKFCPDCGDMNRGDVPSDAIWMRAKKVFGPYLKSVAIYLSGYQLLPVARTQEIMFDLFGVTVSQGSLCHFLKDISSSLRDWELSIKSQLINSHLLHADETSIRCEKRNDWVHVLSSDSLTLLSHDESRSVPNVHAKIGVLPEYRGHLVRDGFKGYGQFRECTQSFCNAHILRELKYLFEEEKQEWANDFSKFLKLTLKKKTPKFRQQYAALLKRGFKELGYANEWKGRPPDGYKNAYENGQHFKIPTYKRRKNPEGLSLLERLRDSFDQVMAFAINKNVPFTNNQAERDLRMLKVKEKISGCFRSKEQAKCFLLLRSFISTLKKQDLPVIENIYFLQVLDI